MKSIPSTVVVERPVSRGTCVNRPKGSGSVAGTNAVTLRLEDAFVLMSATFAYHLLSESWLVFAILFLVPDVMMLGYLINARIGAISYNAVHTYIMPVLLAVGGYMFGIHTVYGCALIWIAHIAFDRALGYGLKYSTSFNDTHLGKIGRTGAVGHEL